MSEEYLLDTGVLNAYLRGRPGAVALVDPWLDSGQASTSIIVYGEIVEFLLGRTDFAEREGELRVLLRDVHPYHITYPILERYASVRRAMRRPVGPGLIGDMDTLIAATALQYGVTVVTLDGDFTRVPGLSVRLLDRSALQ